MSDAGERSTGGRAQSSIDAAGMVLVPAGSFRMGAEDALAYPDDGEGPVRELETSAFWIDRHAVTNTGFAAFVDETGYVTEAEEFGWSFVFAGLLPDDFPPTQAVAQTPWWQRAPAGGTPRARSRPSKAGSIIPSSTSRGTTPPHSTSGRRLPTEAEWERAARGGLELKAFPWGDELEPDGEHRMNVWQGDFPARNSLADGFLGTAPVDAFAPNGYGLLNTTGNVWEWTADWFHPTFRQRDRQRDPGGPPRGTHKVQKGGSYLCHHSYCRRYRPAARTGNTPESSTGNLGFRCARSA